MSFPHRFVHLDFHTSPEIAAIGSRFDKKKFQAALKAGHVESITVFAKCHHGYCFYPTKVGTMHPHLDFDLVAAETEAAHEIGVLAPVYITAGWCAHDAATHPEWVMKRRDGTPIATPNFKTEDPDAPFGYCAWQLLCLNDGAYARHIYAITEEICTHYARLDGLFYDICTNGKACFCDECRAGMKQMGLDAESDADAHEYFVLKHRAFMQKCTDILKKHHPDATIFFNGTVGLYSPEYHEFDSQYEMENLPTAWGGYNSLALRARVFSHMGKPVVGMTGKFHRDWGEFGGFKSKEALRYEVAAMAMYGAAASVGDHLHPDGEMEEATYEQIGYAYEYAERIAPYSFSGKPCVSLGLYPSKQRSDYEANEGVSAMLQESQLDFDVVHDDNFSDFDTVIIPDGVVLDDEALTALKDYLAAGGKLFFMADALVVDGKFQLELGIEYLGAPAYDCDYITPTVKDIDVPDAPLLCNHPSHRVRAEGATVLAETLDPYFSRTYRHYHGHKNTPHDKSSERRPAVLKQGNVVYTAHSLARQYYEYGSLYHRRYFIRALGEIMGKTPLTVHGMGSQGRCTLIHQEAENRYALHLIYASPIKRGNTEVVEDFPTLYGVRAEVKTEKRTSRVTLPLSGETVPFEKTEDGIAFTVPPFSMHTVILIEYENK